MLNTTFLAVVIASTISAVVTTLGLALIDQYRSWGQKRSPYFMSFAAGVLIAVVFLHIIPEAFEMHDGAPYFLLLGFLGTYSVNRFLRLYASHDPQQTRELAQGLIPVLGIGFHSLVDGFIHAVTFNVSILTGVLAAIGMILHEFPEGIVTYVVLKRSGFSRKESRGIAFLGAALTTPLGALLAYPFVRRLPPPTLGALLAASAGALVYVSASHLLPAVERENERYTIVALIAGMLVAVAITLLRQA